MKKSQAFANKIKNLFTLSTLAKILVVALIVIFTLFSSLFDPSQADWKKVLSNFILSVVILMGAFISQLSSTRNKEMEKENYITSRDNHINQVHAIQHKQLSHMHKLYVKDENEKNKLAYIQDVFTQYEIEIAYYTMELKLVKTALSKGIIDKEQYSVIQICRKGKIAYDKYDVRDLTTTQILKKGTNSNKSQQGAITASNLLGKMSWMLAFSIIWAMFVWDEASQQGINGQAWIDLGSRLFTFAGGLWTGAVTAKEIIEDDIRLFDKFYNFNCKFVQDFENGIWKPAETEIHEDIVEHLKKLSEAEEIAASEPKNEQGEETEEIELTEEQLKLLKTNQGSR